MLNECLSKINTAVPIANNCDLSNKRGFWEDRTEKWLGGCRYTFDNPNRCVSSDSATYTLYMTNPRNLYTLRMPVSNIKQPSSLSLTYSFPQALLSLHQIESHDLLVLIWPKQDFLSLFNSSIWTSANYRTLIIVCVSTTALVQCFYMYMKEDVLRHRVCILCMLINLDWRKALTQLGYSRDIIQNNDHQITSVFTSMQLLLLLENIFRVQGFSSCGVHGISNLMKCLHKLITINFGSTIHYLRVERWRSLRSWRTWPLSRDPLKSRSLYLLQKDRCSPRNV